MALTWFLIASHIKFAWATREVLVDQTVRHLPTMWETQVRSLSGEDPLEKEMATHSSIYGCHGWRSLVGYIPWGHRVGHDWATSLSLFFQFLEHIKCFPSVQVVYMLFSQYIPLPVPKHTTACHNQSPPNQTIFCNRSLVFSLNIPF